MRLLPFVFGSLLAFGVACSDVGDGEPNSPVGCPSGQEGCACAEGESCDAGLECKSGACAKIGGMGGVDGNPDPVDHCAEDPCENGRCDSTTDGFSCSCDAGWMGDACDQEVENGCDDLPCDNGTCTDLMGGDYSCACESGWSGPNCDHNIDDCANGPCKNGTCTDGVDAYTCTCDPGWEGATCDTNIDDCASDPCENGTCIDDLNDYSCSCDTGWTGDNCDQEVENGCDDSPCSYGTCTDTGSGTYSCACDTGWDGENCDACATDYSLERGACINQKQVACNAENLPINAAAIVADVTITYTTAGGWTTPVDCAFTCHPGWEGADCSQSTDDCPGNLCENGSLCVDQHQGYSCSCLTGFTGDFCEIDIDDCSESPCDHGTCVDGVDSYSCTCETGWDGVHCDVCAADYFLEDGACINQKQVACNAQNVPANATATIADVTITYTMAGGWTTPADCAFSCNPGWEGTDCSQSVDDCIDHACENGSLCVDGHQSYSCSCPAGFTGDFCETNVDDCADDPCDHGTCVDGIDSYSCSCDTGWGGQNCDVCAADYILDGGACINEKQVACTNNSPANATATIANVTITYTTVGGWTTPADCAFSCNPGWEGTDCSQSVDDCIDHACENGSLCVDGHQSYSCSCPAGFTGDFCEIDIDDCSPDPCVHGECIDGVDSYSCTCNPGWDGGHCDVCATDYILEQGACINEKQVACNDGAPEYATSIPGSVIITYTTAGGWTTPADCAFTCHPGWEGDDCDVSTACNCPGTEVCDGEGACYEPGLIDDFRTCDLAIYEAEGRNGNWYFYRGAAVSCEGICEDVSAIPWGSECGAWIRGGGAGPQAWAGMGFNLKADGPLYDACDYDSIEVTYGSGQAVRFFAKWNDVDIAGNRSSVTLPATSGISTETVDLWNFAGIDCSTLTEFQFEPTDIASGYGIAVYDVRFTGGSAVPCTDGALRCGWGGGLEECVAGEWTSSSCGPEQHCFGNQCVENGVPPVELHGHLAVSGTHLVDQHGQPVQLKGISSHWLNWAHPGYQLSLSALEWMRDHWNLSVFRAAMGTEVEGGYLTSPANRDAMLGQVETIIDNAVTAGIYVIVDWHSHHAHEQTADAVEFFEDIAHRYGYLPNVLFEVYNEPLAVDWNSVLKPYHETLVAAIRGADSDNNENVIILGTPNWDQDVDVVIPQGARVAGNNLMYALHFYTCDHTDWHRSKAQSALSAGAPLFVSEWGATAADGGIGGTAVCSGSADAWHSWMDANHISWAAWKLDDCAWELDNPPYVADTSCLLARGAPLSGGWTNQWLNGHGPYVVSKMRN